MKQSINPYAKYALALVLSVSFSFGSAFAYNSQDYTQNSNKVMPASRGNLHAAALTWQEAQVNHDINWLRALQNYSKTIFGQEMSVRASGGGSSSKTGSSSPSAPKSASTPYIWSTIFDKPLAAFVQSKLAGDNLLTRQDMIDIFREVELDNWVTQYEYMGLQTIEAYTALYPQQDYVYSLSNNIVNGDLWNSTYNGVALGNLSANVPGTFLESLVDKWFLGMDHPEAVSDYGTKYNYQLASGSLFVNGASYDDIRQGFVGDCWFLTSLAEVAVRDVSIINGMFIDNKDNTYTVRLYNNGVADYFTVDKYLPVDSSGRLAFANAYISATNPNNELWVELAEKAAAQAYSSWYGTKNEYLSISGDWIGSGLNMVAGYAATYFSGWNNGTGLKLSDFDAVVASWKAGAMIGFATKSTGVAYNIVANHAYAVIAYDALRKTFTLFNPWGVNNPYGKPGLVTLTWSAIQTSFAYYDFVKK